LDPPIIVEAFPALEPGTVVRWQSDKYGFCAAPYEESDNRCLILHDADSGKFEYLGNVSDFVIAYDKETVVIRPSIDSFQPDLMPSERSTGELYFRDGSPVLVVQTGDASLALLNLESGTLQAFEPDDSDSGPRSGFTAWSLGVWQSDGEFLALIEVDCEYGDGEETS
jgi:hypothetical protein